jgi:hypothetical protein
MVGQVTFNGCVSIRSQNVITECIDILSIEVEKMKCNRSAYGSLIKCISSVGAAAVFGSNICSAQSALFVLLEHSLLAVITEAAIQPVLIV